MCCPPPCPCPWSVSSSCSRYLADWLRLRSLFSRDCASSCACLRASTAAFTLTVTALMLCVESSCLPTPACERHTALSFFTQAWSCAMDFLPAAHRACSSLRNRVSLFTRALLSANTRLAAERSTLAPTSPSLSVALSCRCRSCLLTSFCTFSQASMFSGSKMRPGSCRRESSTLAEALAWARVLSAWVGTVLWNCTDRLPRSLLAGGLGDSSIGEAEESL
mmetsp:Transcript_14394/g.31530  ORF Transcript_14394/g.31530 Transcript_14394/m.31530 type:complete len:221 (-) Transcript_14394:725-1387(-)